MLTATLSFANPTAKVFLVVIDGVRDLEIRGKAEDDFGRRIPAESLFPFLSGLKEQGAFFPEMRISNPSGVSLPGYADLFTGKRQTGILNNDASTDALERATPNLFEVVRKNAGWNKGDILFVSSWDKLCDIATPSLREESSISKSCGYKKEGALKGALYENARTDSETFIEASRSIQELHPRLTFIQFNDADEEAHLQKQVKKKKGLDYGIHHYHQALRNTDYYIGRLWKQIEEDPFYKGTTYLFVTTDHGRDDSGKEGKDFADHGHCLFCSGYKKIFALVAGPEIKKGTFSIPYRHTDIAPTVAKILDTEFSTEEGKIIPELFPARQISSK